VRHLLTDKLQIQITCFHDSATPLDADNMLKPIQDALIGIVYDDDRTPAARSGARSGACTGEPPLVCMKPPRQGGEARLG
jgi:hypothetical protein